MNKMMVVAVAALAMSAFAGDDATAEAEGYYDVTMQAKRLSYVSKTIKKTFRNAEQFYAFCAQEGFKFDEEGNLTETPKGFELIELNGKAVFDVKSEEFVKATKITFKYSRFDYKTDELGNKSYLTKLVTESFKGLYDAEVGNVYLWDAKAKITGVTEDDVGSLVEGDKAKAGFVAYEAPLAMHKQFVATDDGKAVGGFLGGKAMAKDGTVLDFNGLTAFGTGTLDKEDNLKSVAGNVAMKTADKGIGAYGTWKIQRDASAKTSKAGDVKAVLRNKGCVELFMENK